MNIREQKEEIVETIATKLTSSKSVIVSDYRGLNVAQVTELRKQLRDNGVDYKVYKNTMTRLATAKTDLTDLDEVLTGPNAIAFCEEDAVIAAKILVNFAKINDALEIKGGVVEGKVVDLAEIKALASLPSREGLISMFLSVLQAPMRNFALAVKAVADKEEAEGPVAAAPAEEAVVEAAPAEAAPADEAPADEVAEEAPAEDAPADEE